MTDNTIFRAFPLLLLCIPICFCFQLVSLGKSITDFSAEGEEDKDKDKEDMDQDDDHEKLDEEMGEVTRRISW